MLIRVLLCLIVVLSHHQCAIDYSVAKKEVAKNNVRLRPSDSAGKVGSSRRRKPCRLEPLHVEFAELGWDNWIIAPQSYEANTCKGVCDYPLSGVFHPTNHAQVQSIIHSIDRVRVPKACCVPVKYKPLTILHTDKNGETVLRNYKNMIVEACGCR